jgi:hypothetical protein
MRRLMMRRIGIVVFCLMMVLLLGSTLNITGANETQEEMCIPMGAFIIEPPASVEAKRSPVEFPHSIHFNYKCQKCHHKWSGLDEVQSCTTSGCHDLTKSPEKPLRHLEYTDKAIKYYKYAYNKQCIGCHKEIKSENEERAKKIRFDDKGTKILKTGPTGCVDCHPRH